MVIKACNSLNISEQGIVYFDGVSVFSGIDAGSVGGSLASNGVGVAPSFQKSVMVIKSPLINLKLTGNTILFTPASPFVITEIICYGDNLTGTISGASSNIGWTAPNYDDIISGFTAFATIQNNSSFTGILTLPPEYPPVPTGIPLQIKINTADSTATTNEQYIYITGFYL